MLLSSWLWACVAAGGDSAGLDTAPETEAPLEAPDPSGLLPLGDENNYAFDGALDGPTITLAAGQDAEIDFSALDHDLQCHELDPVADIDNVAVLLFRYLSEAEVESGLSNDTLDMSDLSAYLSYEPGDATSFRLSDLSFFGTDPEIEGEFIPGNGSFLVLLTTGTTVGSGARMIGFLSPSDSSSNTTGSLSDGCSVLTYEADLSSLRPLTVLQAGPWNLDWSSVTTTGQGGAFTSTDVTSIMLAYYENLDAAALEAQFLDIEIVADRMWTAEHPGGTTADLSLLADSVDGSVFPGFASEGTYLLALRCASCPNPAPLVLTELVPWRQ